MQEKYLRHCFYICVQGADKIMKTLDNIGIKLFVLDALKEHQLYFPLFFCLFMLCNAIVSALQMEFNNSLCESTAKWETCQIFKEDRLLVHV